MNQIEKIQYMEQILNRASEVMADFEKALENYTAVQVQLQELSEYYGSEEWFRDFDDDNAGKFPRNLRRGVLSEDAIYNLLSDNRRLLEQMQEVSKDGMMK